MGHPDTSFIFDLKKDNISKIEHFVDFICDQLWINETYNGNILLALAEFFNIAKEVSKEGEMNISYTTDYQKITITLQPIDNQLYKIITDNVKVEDTASSSIQKSLYLMKALIDRIEINHNNSINLVLDISAIHNKIYSHRQITLNSYFEQSPVKHYTSNDLF